MDHMNKRERAEAKFRLIAEIDRQERNHMLKLAHANQEWTNRLGDCEHTMSKELSFFEKYALYQATTPFDIDLFSYDDRRTLIDILSNVLCQNTNPKDHGSRQLQNRLLEGLEERLRIKRTYSREIDLKDTIDEIDSKKTEKAILQVLMEMLFLENNDHTYLSRHIELIEFFSYAGKSSTILREIQKSIDAYGKAAGVVGLSEKYFRI